MSRVKNENMGVIKGKITNIKKMPGIVVMQVYTKTKKVPNFPTVVFTGENAKEAEKFEKKDRVEILGSIETIKIKNNDNNSFKISQEFSGYQIKKAKSLLESPATDKAFENTVKVSGQIVAINELTDNIKTLTVSCKENTVKVTIYNADSDFYKTNELKEGNDIVAFCSIQTKFKERDDNKKIKRDDLILERFEIYAGDSE